MKAGDRVGRYTLLEKLGQGGMGVVWSAVDGELRRHVALKILRTDKIGRKRELAQKRLLREAQAMAMVSHEHLVTIYDVGTYEEHVFLAMEQVHGRTLKKWLEDDPSTPRIMAVMDQVGRALQAIHDAGLVHRDVKPDNVIVTDAGRAMLLDLGIARKVALETAEEERVEESLDTDSDAFQSDLTVEGALVGTPAFMAPEQIAGDEAGPAADQFAFGVVLYQALAKQPPYPGTKAVELLAHVLRSNLRPWPDDVDVPEELEAAVNRSLDHDPDQRFASMHDLLDACRRALGLRAKLDHLAQTWIEHARHQDHLLTGELLREGSALLREIPDALSGREVDFIRSSIHADSRRRMTRRALIGGLGVLGVGMASTFWVLRRRTEALERETKARVRTTIATVREAVEGNFEVAESLTRLMVDQRRVWMPHARALLAVDAESEERDASLLEHIRRLNDYFRPVVEGTPTISSLHVATDQSEYMVFDDPDAHALDPPYRFYNRWVDVASFGGAMFQVFWHEDDARWSWLHPGELDSRGRVWTRYDPGRRVWFENARARTDTMAWTRPYLFYVTRDPGITGALSWEDEGTLYALGVDFMLMDISTTRQLRDDGMLAVLMTGEADVVSLPRDPRFRTHADARRFFAERAQAPGVDARARLPTVPELGIDALAVAVDRASEDVVVQLEVDGRTHWAGKSRVGRPEQDLFVLVVDAC